MTIKSGSMQHYQTGYWITVKYDEDERKMYFWMMDTLKEIQESMDEPLEEEHVKLYYETEKWCKQVSGMFFETKKEAEAYLYRLNDEEVDLY